MEKLHQSPVWTIYWHEAAQCLHFIFHEYTKIMLLEEYLQELNSYIELVKKYKPKSIYADTRTFHFTIEPDLQEYINENILQLYSQIGTEKHAIVVSKDMFSALSVEQTMDENQQASYINRYFDNPENAEQWLQLNTQTPPTQAATLYKSGTKKKLAKLL